MDYRAKNYVGLFEQNRACSSPFKRQEPSQSFHSGRNFFLRFEFIITKHICTLYRLRDLRSDMFRFIYHKYLNIESTRIIEFWHPLLGTKYMSCLVGCDLKLFDMAWFPFPNHAHSPRVTHTMWSTSPLPFVFLYCVCKFTSSKFSQIYCNFSHLFYTVCPSPAHTLSQPLSHTVSPI